MSSRSERRDVDVRKLIMSDYNVEQFYDGNNQFNVEFHGPKESLYVGGVWKVRVELPYDYPYKPPSILFLNRIFHPNIDELFGSVCLDVLDKSWSSMFDLVTVFQEFLPQLLLYPDASDPMNFEAASLLMKDPTQYEQKVKEWCELYAKKEDISFILMEDSEDDDDNGDSRNGFCGDEVDGKASSPCEHNEA